MAGRTHSTTLKEISSTSGERVYVETMPPKTRKTTATAKSGPSPPSASTPMPATTQPPMSIDEEEAQPPVRESFPHPPQKRKMREQPRIQSGPESEEALVSTPVILLMLTILTRTSRHPWSVNLRRNPLRSRIVRARDRRHSTCYLWTYSPFRPPFLMR
jgi:hypothetical protein